MTFIHNIDKTPSASAFPDNNIAAANQTFLAPGSIDEALLNELLHHGAQVSPTRALPELPRAKVDYTDVEIENLVAVPSMGASMMEAIVSMSSLMRRQNAELRSQEINAMAAQMDSQATGLREKASAIWWSGVTAGCFNIAAGFASGFCASQMSTKMAGALESEFNAINQKWAAFNAASTAMWGGAATITQAAGQKSATEFDAAIKNSEATVERSRANMEFMKSLEESMREVINKAIATQDAIQQNTNQTRAKILG